jgi:thiol-disulfide isomerase/thioredoxin
MNSEEELYNDLIESAITQGVFVETADDHLQWSDEFSKIRDQELESLEDDSEFNRAHEQYFGTLPEQNQIMTSEILASANAIQRMVPTIDANDALLLAETFARFEREEFTEGVPEGFIPISGAEIEEYINQSLISILYFWREDCPACQTMKNTLERLLEDESIPDDIGTAAIYGPNYASLLREKYQVKLAPTVLFVKNGSTETRHVGETYEQVLINELDSIID